MALEASADSAERQDWATEQTVGSESATERPVLPPDVGDTGATFSINNLFEQLAIGKRYDTVVLRQTLLLAQAQLDPQACDATAKSAVSFLESLISQPNWLLSQATRAHCRWFAKELSKPAR